MTSGIIIWYAVRTSLIWISCFIRLKVCKHRFLIARGISTSWNRRVSPQRKQTLARTKSIRGLDDLAWQVSWCYFKSFWDWCKTDRISQQEWEWFHQLVITFLSLPDNQLGLIFYTLSHMTLVTIIREFCES